MSVRRFLRRPRYADVTATLALVFALSGTAYAVVTVADPNSVNTAAIQDQAVTTPKIANEAVSSDQIAPGAVTGDKLAPGAVTLADLGGVDATGAISFSLAAHGCGFLTLGVPGAKVGQAALLTWLGTTNPPQGVLVGPLKVVKAGRIQASACNLTAQTIAASNVQVRVTTLP